MNRLGMSARAGDRHRQDYEESTGQSGLITYMRTDSVSDTTITRDSRHAIGSPAPGEPGPSRTKNASYATRNKSAQGSARGHPSRPTLRRCRRAFSVLSADRLQVYTLIWRRFTASQMDRYRYATMAVEIKARDNGALACSFRASASALCSRAT
ncbi:MAG: hypothetical protein IPF51_06040 [Dehalococcoidia bacterium]|nr:hypothetical protein [Dehalococcoidia bacterium]